VNYHRAKDKGPLRIAVVTTFYPPCNFGGDGNYIRNFVHSLARRGCEVEVVYDADAWRVVTSPLHPPPPPSSVAQPAGITVHQLESGWPLASTLLTHQTGRPIVQKSAIEAILAKGFDVVHFHNISLVGGPGVLALGDGIKLLTVHDHWLICQNHILWRHNRELCDKRECFRCALAFGRPPQTWRQTSLLEDKLTHVDEVIALSQSVAERHREFGLKREMLRMASFMPDSESKASHAPSAPSHHRPYFLFVGRLQNFKGLQDVIPCFNDDSPADLLVAGTGEYETELRELANGRKTITFLGQVEPERLACLYRDAIALIAPSLCYEVFPMVALEAFREGTPVIARNLGPYPQIIEESQAGLLFDDEAGLRDAITALASDPAYRDRLGAAGQAALAERWTETTAIDEWLTLVRSVAERKGLKDTVQRIDALPGNPKSQVSGMAPAIEKGS
jgi:glycosyltransferase involved in cell wall biosynthesis